MSAGVRLFHLSTIGSGSVVSTTPSVVHPVAMTGSTTNGPDIAAAPPDVMRGFFLEQRIVREGRGGRRGAPRMIEVAADAGAGDDHADEKMGWASRARGRVSQQMVLSLITTIATQPHALSSEHIGAIVDGWGRGALKYLRGIGEEEVPEYGVAQYLSRYLKRRACGTDDSLGAVTASTHSAELALRGSGCVPMPLTNAGWPAVAALPAAMSVYLMSKLPLESPWMQAEFVGHVTRGLHRGRILIGHAVWPGYEEHAEQYAPAELYAALDPPTFEDIGRDRIVLMKPVREGHMRREDYLMLLRAAAEVGKEVVPRRKPSSTKPAWWRIATNPFGSEAAGSYLREIMNTLSMPGLVVRLFSRDRLRWMRMGFGLMARMEFAPVPSPPAFEWGVIGEGESREEAHFVRERAEAVLSPYGEKL